MARYCHGCDVVEYDVSGIQVHTLVPNSDSLLVTSGTEGLVVNTVKQLQLLDAHTMIQLQLHMSAPVEVPHLMCIAQPGGINCFISVSSTTAYVTSLVVLLFGLTMIFDSNCCSLASR